MKEMKIEFKDGSVRIVEINSDYETFVKQAEEHLLCRQDACFFAYENLLINMSEVKMICPFSESGSAALVLSDKSHNGLMPEQTRQAMIEIVKDCIKNEKGIA